MTDIPKLLARISQDALERKRLEEANAKLQQRVRELEDDVVAMTDACNSYDEALQHELTTHQEKADG